MYVVWGFGHTEDLRKKSHTNRVSAEERKERKGKKGESKSYEEEEIIKKRDRLKLMI